MNVMSSIIISEQNLSWSVVPMTRQLMGNMERIAAKKPKIAGSTPTATLFLSQTEAKSEPRVMLERKIAIMKHHPFCVLLLWMATLRSRMKPIIIRQIQFIRI